MIYRSVDITRIAGLALGYALLAKLVLFLFSSNGIVSIVWPPSGLALATLLIGGKKYWPGVFIGALAGNIMAGNPAGASIAIAAGSSLEALFGIWLLGRIGRFDSTLTDPWDFLWLGSAGALSACVSALIGVTTLTLSGLITQHDFAPNLRLWWQGDTLGIILLTPFLLVWRQFPQGWFQPGRIVETATCFGLAFLTGQIIFLEWFSNIFSAYANGFLMFAFVVWGAVRFGRQGALLVIGMTATEALLGEMQQVGIFATDPVQTGLLNFWLYMLVLTVVGVELALTVDRERKSAEAALTQSHGLLNKLSTQVPGVIYQFKMNPDGHYCFPFASEAIQDIFEVTPEQVRDDASAAFAVLHPDEYDGMVASILESARTLTLWRREFRVVLPRQGLRWRLGESEPEKLDDGSVLWHGFITDITERKHAEKELAIYRDHLEDLVKTRTQELRQAKLVEERLALSERKYRELVENANSIILRWTRNGHITFINEFGQKFFGYTEDELLGRHVMETIVPPSASDGHDLQQLIEQILSDPEAFAQNINENLRRNGERVWISWTNKIVRDTQEQIVEILSIGTDITERRRAEEQIRRLHKDLQRHAEKLEERVLERTRELAEAKHAAEAADSIKSAFLATMSHELRTPLNSIIGFTGIILQELAGPLNAEQAKQLGMVQGSARHLLALINDVLDISKIEAGELTIVTETFDLCASIKKVASIVGPLAEKKGLSLAVTLAEGIGEMTGDARRVEQILLNLLGNAIKFTEAGSVSFSVDRITNFTVTRNAVPCAAVRIRVTDTGIGIKPEDMELLFQPFRQVDSSLSRSHDGTGLGLAICRRLTTIMGGIIEAESRWQEGSTFTVTLPLRLQATMDHHE